MIIKYRINILFSVSCHDDGGVEGVLQNSLMLRAQQQFITQDLAQKMLNVELR